MQYITYELGPMHYISYGLLGLGALAFLTAIVLFFTGRVSPVYALGGAMIVFAGGVFLIMAEPTKTPTVQDRAAAEAIEEDYGIELTDEELMALDYPREKPTADFEAFGSFEQMLPADDGGYELNRVFLIWDDGEMKLAKSTDGESFSELKFNS